MSIRNEQRLSITKNHVMRVRHFFVVLVVKYHLVGQLTSEAQTLSFAYMVPARNLQGGNGEGGESANKIMIFIRIMMLYKPIEAVSCRDNDHRVTTEQCCPAAVPLSIHSSIQFIAVSDSIQNTALFLRFLIQFRKLLYYVTRAPVLNFIRS